MNIVFGEASDDTRNNGLEAFVRISRQCSSNFRFDSKQFSENSFATRMRQFAENHLFEPNQEFEPKFHDGVSAVHAQRM